MTIDRHVYQYSYAHVVNEWTGIHEDATRGQAWYRHSHDLHILAIDICKCCANLGSVLPKIRPALSARRAAGHSGTHLKPGFEVGSAGSFMIQVCDPCANALRAME